MSFTHEDVQRIIQLLDDSHFDELHLEADGIKLDLRRNGAGSALATGRTPAQPAAATPASPVAAPAASGTAPASSAASAPARASAGEALLDIRAPMLGAFYRAPKPGAEPFVAVGGRVSPDTVIGIIEVMKLMNSVPAGVSGEVVEILGKDGELVEYDQVLVRVRPD